MYRKKGTYKKRKSKSPHGSTPSPSEKDDGRGPLTSVEKRRFKSPHSSTPSPAVRDDGRGSLTPSVADRSRVSPLPDVRTGSSHRPPSPAVDESSSHARSTVERGSSSARSMPSTPSHRSHVEGSDRLPSRPGRCVERSAPSSGGDKRRSLHSHDRHKRARQDDQLSTAVSTDDKRSKDRKRVKRRADDHDRRYQSVSRSISHSRSRSRSPVD